MRRESRGFSAAACALRTTKQNEPSRFAAPQSAKGHPSKKCFAFGVRPRLSVSVTAPGLSLPGLGVQIFQSRAIPCISFRYVLNDLDFFRCKAVERIHQLVYLPL
jgi:hypothetical protein